jgi:uncharacterized protein with HEPN domain
MNKDDSVYIGHMLDLMRKAVERARAKGKDAYDADEDLRIVLAHLVQMIGEAANRVSVAGRVAHSTIPWKQVIGVRHRIVHDYMEVDYDIIWEIVSHDFPPLIPLLASILGEQ